MFFVTVGHGAERAAVARLRDAIEDIARWCNGSTRPFGGQSQGSNPCRATIAPRGIDKVYMNDMQNHIKLFSGNANRPLAEKIAARVGIALSAAEVTRFPDGEISVTYEETVRGRDVFIIQPTGMLPNEYLMELLIMTDAARRASAGFRIFYSSGYLCASTRRLRFLPCGSFATGRCRAASP